tara:strand:+ start:3037 stop:3756 length:720 start_codon:yes stop_codon:yes gene_type:complete
MNIPWLNMNTNKRTIEHPSKIKHQILGTCLDAPIKAEEGEIIFGCGCFWGTEKAFWKLPGIITTAVGYAGGKSSNPTYKEVCLGITGHTEVVRIIWQKSQIDISDLLKLFWECHDPTQGNRQGNDRGTQYRSAIYTTNEFDLKMAIDSKDFYQRNLQSNGFKEITTEIKNKENFYFAENYHQQYLAKPGSRPYCSAMPTNIPLGDFPNCNYKLNKDIWSHFDWTISHCILRSDNNPINI